MANIPTDLRYTSDHEWIRTTGDSWRVGITEFAAKQLGDVVFVELPKVGDLVTKGQSFGTIESVKAVSEMFAPVSGRITAINEDLSDDPELINTETYGEGWLVEIQPSDKAEADDLLDAAAYDKLVSSEQG